MLLVYTHKITPRVTYIFKHIFTRILQIPIDFTTKIEEFIAHDGLKISYSKKPLGNELYVRSIDLLFNQGIDYPDITVTRWEDTPCFFQANSPSPIPFDVFAASFYLLSRYEEYLPHVKDEFERFPAEESLAYQNNFLDKPVVDIWAYKLKDLIKEKYPDYEFKERNFEYISTIDVDVAFDYKYKGFVRSIGATLKDVAGFRIHRFIERFMVIFNMKKDPFDTYSKLISLQRKFNIPTIFFFQLGDYSTYDKNISVKNSKYKLLVKDVADYAKVGLHPSYFTMKNDEKLKKEKKRMENIVNFQVVRSRQHFLRLELPETYQNLVDVEIAEDYTMGFAQHYGFRAGTCTPFHFYDLDFEIQTPLKVIPFSVMDGTLKDYLNLTTKRSFDTIYNLAKEVKKVDGTFITLFHNESVSGAGRWRGWDKKYEELMERLSKLQSVE
ncbi:MAG: polysaccharide deacetylase family protein [Bacteroidota bacterium]